MRRDGLIALFGVALLTGACAAPRSSWTDTWILADPDRASPNLGGVTGGGPEMRIDRTEHVIRIDRPYGRGSSTGDNRWVFTVKLDGSASPHSGPMLQLVRPGQSKTASSTATQAVSTLTIATTTMVADSNSKQLLGQRTIKETLTLQGDRLVVERTDGNTPLEREAYLRKK